MKMENTTPIKLKPRLGRPQAAFPPSALSELMDEIEKEKAEETELRTLRIERFVRLHGNKKHGMCPAADQCLTKALSQEPPKVWQDFIARLGQFNPGEIQQCISEAKYLRADEYPWQVALTKINPTWKNIIATASYFELWKVCNMILNEFRVPHDDAENADSAVPAPERENCFMSNTSTLASGKEPEENDDHNNSELSASPPEDNLFPDSGFTGLASPTESDQKVNCQLNFNGFPLNQKSHLYSATEVERCPTDRNRRSPSHLNMSPPSCKIANNEWDQEALWKLPPTHQVVSEAVTNRLFYQEGVEVPDMARAFNNPFLQNTAASVSTSTVTNTQGATAAPQMMMYPPQYSLPYWHMQGPTSPMVCVPVMCPSLPGTTSTASYVMPMHSFANGQSFPVVPAGVAPPMQMLYDNNATGAQFSMVTTGLSQPSAVTENPVFSTAPSRNVSVTASRTPTVAASTNPFANELNAHNSVSNANWYSLPINGNGAAGGAYGCNVALPPSDRSEAEVVSEGPNVPHRSSGAVSLPNMNQNKMTVFLTYSADAYEDAQLLKGLLRERIRGIRIITHDVLDGSPNFTTPEKIDRIFHNMDFIIPIISRQYLEDVKVEVASSNPNAGAIRSLYVKCLNNFYYDGCKNLKVRAWRLSSVPYEEVKKLPSCMATALGKAEKLVDILHHCFESRKNSSGNPQG